MLLLLAIACVRPAPSDVLNLDLDPSAISGRTGRLIGWSLSPTSQYAAPSDALNPAWRTDPRTEALTRLGTIRGPGNVDPWWRMSGPMVDGTYGQDGFHFDEPGDQMAPYQFIAMANEADAQPLITLNFGSGTAAEAGNYATHLNSTDTALAPVAQRVAWGQTDPFDIGHFEIGNAPYDPDSTGFAANGEYSYANASGLGNALPQWHGRPSDAAENYSERALSYIEAVLSASPEATFWIPLSSADMLSWQGTTEAVQRLAPLLEHPSVQTVVIQHRQIDDALSLGFGDPNTRHIALGASSLMEVGYRNLREDLATLNRDEPLQIAVVDYGTAGAKSTEEFNLGSTAAMGLGAADALILFARLGIEHAAQQVSLDWHSEESTRDPNVWTRPYRITSEGDMVEMPSARVTRLISDFMLENTLETHFQNNPLIRGGDGSDIAPLFHYDSMHGVAFANDAGDEVTLIILNRSPDLHLRTQVTLPGNWTVDEGLAWSPRSWQSNVFAEDPDPDDDVEIEPDIPIDRSAPWRETSELIDISARPNTVSAIRMVRQ